jgi:hypothetical protein
MIHNTVVTFDKINKTIQITQNGTLTKDYEAILNSLDNACLIIHNTLNAADVRYSLHTYEDTIKKSITFQYV